MRQVRRDDAVLLPPQACPDDVTRLKLRRAAGHDTPDHLARYDATYLHSCCVRLRGADPAPHVGVERQPDRLQQYLSMLSLGNGRLFEVEI